MSAPTLWEEGRWSATRITRLAVVACALLVALDLLVTGSLGLLFDVGFVLVCVGAALAVRPSEFFRIGTLPPVLLLVVCGVLALVDRAAIASARDGLVQALISGLAHHSGALLVGYALCLGVLAIRSRVLARRSYAEPTTVEEPAAHSNRDGSPAPYRVTSGAPEVKSTTVVGSEPTSPESRTASNS